MHITCQQSLKYIHASKVFKHIPYIISKIIRSKPRTATPNPIQPIHHITSRAPLAHGTHTLSPNRRHVPRAPPVFVHSRAHGRRHGIARPVTATVARDPPRKGMHLNHTTSHHITLHRIASQNITSHCPTHIGCDRRERASVDEFLEADRVRANVVRRALHLIDALCTGRETNSNDTKSIQMKPKYKIYSKSNQAKATAKPNQAKSIQKNITPNNICDTVEYRTRNASSKTGPVRQERQHAFEPPPPPHTHTHARACVNSAGTTAIDRPEPADRGNNPASTAARRPDTGTRNTTPLSLRDTHTHM